MHFRVTLAAVLFLTGLSHAEIGEIDINAGPPASAPEPANRSALWLRSSGRATVLLIDSKGRRSGVNPKTRALHKEIPGTQADADLTINKYTGEGIEQVYQHIEIKPAPKGNYQVILRGVQPGPYEVNILALSSDGSSEPNKQLEGLISDGEEKRFQLHFDPAPNSALSVVEQPR